MMSPEGTSKYACNMLGVARCAYDGWCIAKDSYESAARQDDRELYTGYCRAYSQILRVVTGIPATVKCQERWAEWIKTAPTT
jgi:hypothetical protein